MISQSLRSVCDVSLFLVITENCCIANNGTQDNDKAPLPASFDYDNYDIITVKLTKVKVDRIVD